MPGVVDRKTAEEALENLTKLGIEAYWEVQESEDDTFMLVMDGIRDYFPREMEALSAFETNDLCRFGIIKFDRINDKHGYINLVISDEEMIKELADPTFELKSKIALAAKTQAPPKPVAPKPFFPKIPEPFKPEIPKPFKPENFKPIHTVNKVSTVNVLSQILRSQKSYDDFKEVRQLSEDDASGLMSHHVTITKKNPPSNISVTVKQAEGKYKHEWYEKLERNVKVANTEVIAQELFRLFIPNHPKTRLVIDEQGKTYVSSREVSGFQPLEKISPKIVSDKLASGEYRGLGEVMVMALWLNERDLKLGNMGIDKNGKVVKIDGDWCFAQFRDVQSKMEITEKSLSQLPLNTNIDAYNWLDLKRGGQLNSQPVIASFELQNNPQFRTEVHREILKIMLLPDELLQEFVHHYISDQTLKEHVVDFLIERKNTLSSEALESPDFCSYVQSKPAELQVANFKKQLDDFKLTGKMQLNSTGRNDNINDRFKDIQFDAMMISADKSSSANKPNANT